MATVRLQSRDGFTIAELLVSLGLFGVIATALAIILHTQTVTARAASKQTANDEAVRVAVTVLASESRSLLRREDVAAVTDDSLSLRAFRGIGTVCSATTGKSVLRYHGMRMPDVDKDSLLILPERAVYPVTAWQEVSGQCNARTVDDAFIELVLPLRIGAVALFFERGSYHLTDRALRFRRGAEGRQPITEELFDAKSGFASTGTDSVVRASVLTNANRTRPATTLFLNALRHD